MMRALGQAVWRGLRHLATGLLGLVILFEEWGWEPLQRVLAWVGRLPVLRQIEAAIGRLPPGPALAIFLLPTVLLLPVKLAALWLLSHGHALLGAGVIVIAKLVGTAIVARLFTLTRPALMRLAWFASAYTRWVAWKDSVIARVRASWAWRAGRVARRAVQRRWERLRASFNR
ncbi:hypothetical protein [Ideonella sp. A 288]|uniref:hypothetical protein n=1 Tax=Ideonella sp. A 288 TaxID=1962181 RepID=UPI002873AB45|nr:hypothetical protein [Ideonella sp. A 288]